MHPLGFLPGGRIVVRGRAVQPASDSGWLTTPTGDPLLATKFSVPEPPPGVVVRTRLLDLLRAGTQRPLTLVSAPAGAGKTVLVSSWAARGDLPGPLTWITLEDGDNRPGVFWAYVVEGLRRSGLGLPKLGAPARSDSVDRAFVGRLADCLTAAPQPVVLVLDSVDHFSDPAVADDLQFLLQHASSHLRVVLMTRVDPLLPLRRYRLDGVVTEIRVQDLAFTTAEASALLGRGGVPLSEPAIAALTRRTEGWAAGLRFAALALSRQPDPEQAALELSGDVGNIAEYLLAEVLDTQPADVRDLLLRTSVVELLRPGLIEALSGRRHGPRMLEALVHANAFVRPVPDAPGCYRYDPLFRELLRAQLADESPEAPARLHHIAARWMAAHDLLGGAVAHATVAGAWSEAADYVVRDLAIGRFLAGRDSGRLAELFARLPSDTPGPSASVIRAAQAAADRDLARCRRHLAEARQALGDAPPGRARSTLLTIATLELACARAQAAPHAGLASATQAQALLGNQADERTAAPADLRALVLADKASLLLWRGDVEAAEGALTDGVHTAEAAGCEPVLADCLGQLAVIDALRGRLRRAAEHAERAVTVAEASGTPPADRPAAAEVALAWMRTDVGDLAAAREHVTTASVVADRGGDPMLASILGLVRGRLHRLGGDRQDARRAVAETRVRARGLQLPTWLDHRLRILELALTDAGERAEPVLNTVEGLGLPEARRMIPRPRSSREELPAGEEPPVIARPAEAPLDFRVGHLLHEVSRSVEQGDSRRAKVALERALRLAAPERLRRPFLEAPGGVRRLLDHDHGLTERHRWLRLRGPDAQTGRRIPARTRTRQDPGRDGSPVIEPLTAKEREVLGHLAELLTTEEIAGVMFVSVNTVRTHVRSILRKLSVSRRNEAVRRARELRLIAG
jgi:LuxR family transcriptional regulator, maltose regulon positive regulatory protein